MAHLPLQGKSYCLRTQSLGDAQPLTSGQPVKTAMTGLFVVCPAPRGVGNDHLQQGPSRGTLSRLDTSSWFGETALQDVCGSNSGLSGLQRRGTAALDMQQRGESQRASPRSSETRPKQPGRDGMATRARPGEQETLGLADGFSRGQDRSEMAVTACQPLKNPSVQARPARAVGWSLDELDKCSWVGEKLQASQ